MKQPISGDNIAQYKAQKALDNVERADEQDEDQRLEPEKLAILLEQLLARFAAVAEGDDLDMLGFCLHYLFYQIDAFYGVALPALAASPPHTRLLPGDDLPYYHHNWHQLEHIRRILERMEALGHLLNEAAASVLDMLDTASKTSDAYTTTHTPHAYQCCWLRNGEARPWKAAFAALDTRLHYWQRTHSRCRSFSTRFAQFLPTIPNIVEMDSALDDFLRSISALYGNNLHALLNATTLNEQTAPLLIDTIQQADLLLSSIDLLMEPLHGLMKNFALANGMY